jgi:hypothetical protein
MLEICATDRASLERDLNEAELLVRQEAMKARNGGVLITRLSGSHFTVALSDSVPFGLTRELSPW